MTDAERARGGGLLQARPRFTLLTVDDLASLPDPQWLIERYMEERASVCVYGPSGDGKTFLLFEWALSIATGMKHWQGLKVKSGGVVYVMAEGGYGAKKRVAAWMKARGVERIDNLVFLLEPVQLRIASEMEQLQQ